MKAGTILTFIVALLAFSVANTARADDAACSGRQTPATVRLFIDVSDLHSQRGQVAVTVYPDNPGRFLAHGGKLTRDRIAATPPVRACFWLTPGVAYAVAVYHDENGNKDFDRNAVGMPAEGFGFSNDAPTRFGLPQFDAVRFRLPAQDTAIRIHMRYLKK